MSRLVVISPHLDDAVFSCGTLIAAAALVQPVTVMTVLAGIPDHFDHATALDAAAGFSSSQDAMWTRRLEDEKACDALGADWLHLDVLDSQYADGDGGRVAVMRGAIKAGLEHIGVNENWADDDGQATVVAPLGIRHGDHKHVAEACAGLANLVYQELPYRVLWPELVPTVGAFVQNLPCCDAKRAAIACYRSQLGDGPPGAELYDLELYHRPA